MCRSERKGLDSSRKVLIVFHLCLHLDEWVDDAAASACVLAYGATTSSAAAHEAEARPTPLH